MRLVVVLLSLAGCQRAPEAPWLYAPPSPPGDPNPAPVFQNVATPTDYVGDAACASCHAEESEGYRQHGMAHSFYRWTVETRVEAPLEAPLHHAATDYYYTVVEAPDGLYQEEYLRSPEGVKVHQLRRRMDYVVGSGHAARTYLAESNGWLYELPLTWYTQAKRWDFSPGYQTQNGRFDRLIPSRCMACHNSYPTPVPFADGKYVRLPLGIGCERCHGPGALHVEARLADPEPTAEIEGRSHEIDPTIVNPAHLPYQARMDVCQQCHFSAPGVVPREGRGAFDFRPSDLLATHRAVFIPPQDEADGRIDVVSHAARMQQSACFRGTVTSARPLECVTCHNPHEGFRNKGPDYFNRTCQRCHAAPTLPAEHHATGANCIGCHMPRVQAEDAPHSSFTDHWVRVVGQEARPPSATDAAVDPLVPYFRQDYQNRTGQAYLGMALVVQGRQTNDLYMVSQGAATLEAALQADTTLGEGYFLLGVAQQLLGYPEQAVEPLLQAARLDERDPLRLYALAQAFEATGRAPQDIERLYRRALDLQPALADVHVGYGQFLQGQGRRAEAARAYRAARREQPWLDTAPLLLGLVLAEMDSLAAARAAFRDALALNPDHAQAHLYALSADPTASAPGRFQPLALAAGPLLDRARARTTVRLQPDDAGALRFADLPPGTTLRVYHRNGTLLRTVAPADANELRWDGRDDRGRLLAGGLYLLHLRTLDAAGNPRAAQVLPLALVRR
jgi:tetratricopeptide (TPR) repeat protein